MKITFLALVIVTLFTAIGTCSASIQCPPMPSAVTEVNRDVMSDIKASVGLLGRLKVGELEVKSKIVAKNLFEKYPNVDKLLTLQTMAATYCAMLMETTTISEKEKLGRWERFQDKALNFPPSQPQKNWSQNKPEALNNLPYFAYTWIHNYDYLYLSKDSKLRNINNLENKLLITNISNRNITNISITIFNYINNENYDNYFKLYDISSNDYEAIANFQYPNLQQNAAINISIIDVINILLGNATPKYKERFSAYLFPEAGGLIKEESRVVRQSENASNIFTDDKKLLAENNVVTFAQVDGANGLRLKIVVNYVVGGIRFKDLLAGGLFYYTKKNGSVVNTVPAVTDAVLKAPYVLWGTVGKVDGWKKILAPQELSLVNKGRQLDNVYTAYFTFVPEKSIDQKDVLPVTFDKDAMSRY